MIKLTIYQYFDKTKNINIWRPLSLSELTPIIFKIEVKDLSINQRTAEQTDITAKTIEVLVSSTIPTSVMLAVTLACPAVLQLGI